MLNRAGRLVLTKVTLTSMVIYPAIALSLSPWAIRIIDRLRKAFLWKGTEVVSGGHCLVAWPTVCTPQEYGGLGILNLKLMGIALQLRWMWLSKTEPSRPGSNLPTSRNRCMEAMFDASLVIEVKNGQSVLFWKDKWINGHSLSSIAPALVQAVPARVRNTRMVCDALSNKRWVRDIRGGLSVQAILDYLTVWRMMTGIQLQDEPDIFRWRWSTDGKYSASSTYKAFFHGLTLQSGAKQLWKVKAPGRCKFFFWLVLHGRCWTSERLQRHGLPNHGNCALCSQMVELLDHLLLSCVFIREVWYRVLRSQGWQQMTPGQDDQIVSWWLTQRKQLDKLSRKRFDSIVLLTTWKLWNERNARVFRGTAKQPTLAFNEIREEIQSWSRAGLMLVAEALNG
ncbi:unnamed protein product [Urochloa decumbens]|uniref:Reverse transcriptase zinc-binding domain-containing protein n=1 Tax=Urochloa decumbens TaxID=240449 RepID=A0ABC9B5Z9_9POAL